MCVHFFSTLFGPGLELIVSYTTFVIPSDSRGGTLRISGVKRAGGFYIFMNPGVVTRFQFLGFEDEFTFTIAVDRITTNMRFNLEEAPQRPVSFNASGIRIVGVEHGRDRIASR